MIWTYLIPMNGNLLMMAVIIRKPLRTQVWCDLCNKPHHTRDTYWRVHGKLANWKSKSGNMVGRGIPIVNEAETNPFTKEQIEHLQALLKSNPQYSVISVASMAHISHGKNAPHCFFLKDSGNGVCLREKTFSV